jgi:hypothetical protein
MRLWVDQTAFSSLSGIEGLYSNPDQDDPRVKLNYQAGEIALPRFARGKTLTYSGYVAGQTKSAMNAHIAALRACANSGLTNPPAWTLVAEYNSTYDDSGLAFTAYGVPVGFDCDEVQGAGTLIPSPWQRDFTLSFRMGDPRWWVTPAGFLCSVGSSGTPIDGGTPGTLTLTGTAPSEPTFTMPSAGDGSATIVITAAEVAGQLTIDLPDAMADGDTLVVNFMQRTVVFTHSGTSHDYSGYIDWANSNWWNEADIAAVLLVGANTLCVTGDRWYATAVPATW